VIESHNLGITEVRKQTNHTGMIASASPRGQDALLSWLCEHFKGALSYQETDGR
jgi:hypothetical protein